MSVKFNVQSAFNFSTDSYAIVFNTSGSGVTPLPVTTSNNYAGYSIAIVVGGNGGSGVQAQAYYYYRPANTSQAPVLYPISPTPQQLILTLYSGGLQTQFTVIFARIIASFSATTTPTPSPTASAAATASPTASPSPTATASGVAVSNLWNFNFFVLQGQVSQYESQGSLQIVDSLGAGGANDTTYTSPQLDVSTSFDTGAFYVQAGTHPSQSDALAGGDIANNP
ncbi:MAG TPA: hypothetical protein VMF11_02580 [Candidatus Baltobacteraceae bacterium]|nr:hypothetical protein [Candidatus Baltobacteraceae bacterium]